MYTESGVGFLANNVWIAFVPALFMVTFATIACLTRWCFASALHSWIFARQPITAADQASEVEGSKPAGPQG